MSGTEPATPSHGTVDANLDAARLLVFDADRRWACAHCGYPMANSPENHSHIHCTNIKCRYVGWRVERPDLYSCQVISHGPQAAKVAS